MKAAASVGGDVDGIVIELHDCRRDLTCMSENLSSPFGFSYSCGMNRSMTDERNCLQNCLQYQRNVRCPYLDIEKEEYRDSQQ
jgi:hypothetical protein